MSQLTTIPVFSAEVADDEEPEARSLEEGLTLVTRDRQLVVHGTTILRA